MACVRPHACANVILVQLALFNDLSADLSIASSSLSTLSFPDHVEIGSDLRQLKTSLTRSLCDQTFIFPLHWAKATAFPETATHAVDFGPGGLSGIGPLTQRNLEGRGVHVVVLGEKGKGGAELYNSHAIKYEDWWSKKWTPKLVRTRYVYFQVSQCRTKLTCCLR